MIFGKHKVSVMVRTPDGTKFGYCTEWSEEVVRELGMNFLADGVHDAVLKTLNEAYEGHKFGRVGYISQQEIMKRKIWKQVKNINTDEELEEIARLLRINDDILH